MAAACFTLSEPRHQCMIQNVIRRSNNKNQSPSNKSQHLEIGGCLCHCTARRYYRDEGANTQQRLCFLDGCQLLLSDYAISCHCSRKFSRIRSQFQRSNVSAYRDNGNINGDCNAFGRQTILLQAPLKLFSWAAAERDGRRSKITHTVGDNNDVSSAEVKSVGRRCFWGWPQAGLIGQHCITCSSLSNGVRL